MNLKYTPLKLDPRLNDEGKPIPNEETGLVPEGPFLPDLFEGFIEVKMPSYPERIRMPKELGIIDMLGDGNEGEEKQLKAKLSKSLDQAEIFAKAAEKIKSFIVYVNLKCLKEDDLVLQSADDLYTFPDAEPIIYSLCSKFLMGFASKKN